MVSSQRKKTPTTHNSEANNVALECEQLGMLSTSNVNSRDGTPLLTSPTALAPSNTPLQGPNSQHGQLPDLGVMSFSGLEGSSPSQTCSAVPNSDPLSPAPLAAPVNTPLVAGRGAGGSHFPASSFSPSQFSSPPSVSRVEEQ